MKKAELIKTVKAKIEELNYTAIDEAIELAKKYGDVDFFDKFLGQLRTRCQRYNSDHVCSEAKFFDRGMRVKENHFTYRALLGLVNIAVEGSQAAIFRKELKKIDLIGHIWDKSGQGWAFGGDVDFKYISNFESLNELNITEAATISNIETINSIKKLKKLSIYGCNASIDAPFALKKIFPFVQSKMTMPGIIFDSNELEELSFVNVKGIQDLTFLKNLNSLKSLYLQNCQIPSLKGLPSSLEIFDMGESNTIDLKNTSYELKEIGQATALKKLKLDLNHTDYSFLSKLNNLEELVVSSSAEQITIPDLSHMKNLREVNLPTYIEHIDFLKNNTSIQYISFLNSNIKNIDGLKGCGAIKVFWIKRCKNLINVDGLNNCKKIDIQISSSGIENLNGLSKVTNISKFSTYISEEFDNGEFATTEIETYPDGTNDLDLVIRKNSLIIDDCNKLTDISGIKNATNLMGLSITNCENLTTVSGIESLKNLYEIDLTGCAQMNDLSAIKSLPKLNKLNLSGCKKLKVKPSQWILENRADVEKYLKLL